MLTPEFKLSQNDSHLIICIRAPMARLADVELCVEQNEVFFSAKPYFLRLHLPGDVQEPTSDVICASDDGITYTVTLCKVTVGQHFAGLNLLTKILMPNNRASRTAALIEVLQSSTDALPSSILESNKDEEDTLDWTFEQTVYNFDTTKQSFSYGFASLRCNFFGDINQFVEVIALQHPDQCNQFERREHFEAAIQHKFDADHYLADLFDSDGVQVALDYEPYWINLLKRFKAGCQLDTLIDFTDDERFIIKNLPRKEFLLSCAQIKQVLLGLLDLLFAYAFEVRCTEGECSVESAWTVTRLCATLHWLLEYDTVSDVLRAAFSSALAYPLLRNWDLCMRVRRDVLQLLRLGPDVLLHALLQLRSMLIRAGDGYHMLVDLYITDYCVWIQTTSTEVIGKLLKKLHSSLTNVLPRKEEFVHLDIEGWECAGRNALSDAECNS